MGREKRHGVQKMLLGTATTAPDDASDAGLAGIIIPPRVGGRGFIVDGGDCWWCFCFLQSRNIAIEGKGWKEVQGDD